MSNAIVFYPLYKLSALIKNRLITCRALAVLFYEHICDNNTTINCITDLRALDDVLKDAESADREIEEGNYKGPLHGIPMTVKDAFNVEGLISSNGYPLLKNNIATTDACLIRNLKSSGVIIVGKTNLPFLAIDWISENSWFGRTNNPYDLTRVPGGSSGGSAAALASGFTPIELGSDAGGSIRVPAHFCGVCGLRPTDGLLSNEGQFKFPGKPQGFRYITVPGPMARNVTDLQTLFNVIYPENAADNQAPLIKIKNPPEKKYLKIAYSKTLFEVEVDLEYQNTFNVFIEKLRQAGHTVTETSPNLDYKKSIKNWGIIMGNDFGINMPGIILESYVIQAFLYLKYRDYLWSAGMQKGISGNIKAYAAALEYRDLVVKEFNEFFTTYDVWLTPVSSGAAFHHQPTGRPFKINQHKVKYTQALSSFNFPTALGGHPICVIPIGLIKNDIPVGIQIHGRRWHDKQLLLYAKILEDFTDGFQIPKLFKNKNI